MKKVLVRIFIIFIILALLGSAGYFGYNYYLKMNNAEIKQNFYKYAFQNNFSKIFDTSFKQSILKRLNESSYEAVTNVEFSNTFLDTNNFDIDKLTLELNTSSDKINKKSDININYSNNKLFNLSIISNSKYIGFKSEDVLSNYVAMKKENIGNILERINTDINKVYENINRSQITNFTENNISIFLEDYNDYIEIFEKYVTSDNYKDEGTAIIEQNGEKIETQRYSLTISSEEAMNLYSVLTDKIVEDERILDSIVSENKIQNDDISDIQSSLDYNNIIIEEQNQVYDFRQSDSNNTNNQSAEQTNFATDKIEEADIILKLAEFSKSMNNKVSELESYKLLYNGIKYFYSAVSGFSINTTKDNVQKDLNEIFVVLNEFLKEKIDDDSEVKIISYIANNTTIRTSIVIGQNIEIQLDYINKENGNASTKISLLEKIEENYNGYAIYISKNKTSLLESNDIKIEFINNSEIVSKLELNLDIEGSENSNKYNNTFNFLYSGRGNEGKFSSTITNTISFKNTESGVLHSNNCILLEDLEDSAFNYTINKLNYRMGKVYEKQMSKMNLINTNTSDTILQTNNQDEEQEEQNTEEKDRIINVLIETISNEMGQAELEEREYTIQNLKNLHIDGYDIQVSVSQDLAIITINGYKVKIDKDFNLSE